MRSVFSRRVLLTEISWRIGIGHGVGVKNAQAVLVARGAAGGLDERGLRAQKALLVASSTATQRDFGQVEASRSRLMPTSTSTSPVRRLRKISTRSIVSISNGCSAP